MKKIYSFLTLMLLFVMGINTVAAQEESRWDIGDALTDPPVPGQQFVLRRGFNTSWGGGTGYLNPSGAFKTEVDATCIYELATVGIDNEGTPTYALKNASSKQYVVSGGEVRSIADAFHFTVKLAVANSRDKSNNVSEKTAEAEGQCFVFCTPNPNEEGADYYYMCYWGCPAMSNYSDTNDWMLFSASEHIFTSYEKLENAIQKLFPNGVEGMFETGTEIGQYSQAAYDRALAAYKAGFEATEDMSDEQLDAITAELYAAKEALDEGFVNITPGYYFIGGHRSSWDGLFVRDGKVGASKDYARPQLDTLGLNDLTYVWKLDSVPGKPGSFTVKNLLTSTYIGVQGSSSTAFPMVAASSAAKMAFPFKGNGRFFMQDQNGNKCHVDASYWVVRWQSDADPNQYTFSPIPENDIAELVKEQEHLLFLDSLNSLVSEAEGTLKGCDITHDGKYNSRKGLVTTVTGNADESAEGSSTANLFDGNLTSFYSTKWSGGIVKDDDYDWIQANFSHEVEHLYIKMTRRHNNGQNDPTKIRLTKKGEDPAETVWSDILFEDTVIYTYHTEGITVKPIGTGDPANAIAGDSSTAIIKIDLDKPASQIRMSVLKTISNNMSNGAKDLGPLWNLSEIRFYEDLSSDPKFALIPDDIKNALNDAIDMAKAGLADSTATRADYEALEEAIDAFWESYPDPSELLSLIKNTKALLEAAAEGEGIGYFQNGAKAELSAALTTIEGKIEGKTLTLDEIKQYIAEVKECVDNFNTKLNKPEDGKYYRIVSASDNENNNGGYAYMNGADTNASMKHGYKEDENKETRLNAIWQCLKKEDGSFSLRNVGNGLYFGNIYKDTIAEDIPLSAQLKPSTEADTLWFVASPKAGCVNIKLSENRYVNAQPGGNVLVVWSDAGSNSLYTLEEIAADDIYLFNTLDIAANKCQIITLPYAIDPATTSPTPYKLIGQKEEEDGTYAQFIAWDDIIPAGTPFLIQSGEEDNIAQIMFAEMSVEDLMTNPEAFVYTSVEQDGLVGCIQETEIKAGLGVIIDGMIQLSEEGDVVAAGSGYFKEIPETTDEGEIKILIDGVINGIGNTVINGNKPAAIYTISGVKVGTNTKNLPKGIYIINGKKVIVK